ncbi:hypothetical protein [Verminephrobacter aporrectodeae]|uniref:hypothetical protein n=1 Tax=Verminephrobacter aporrectodeae TaxID=1110389 RepID=UPI001110F915|nr:hypothetical protein [Verminephrobacter aporrectodeae]
MASISDASPYTGVTLPHEDSAIHSLAVHVDCGLRRHAQRSSRPGSLQPVKLGYSGAMMYPVKSIIIAGLFTSSAFAQPFAQIPQCDGGIGIHYTDIADANRDFYYASTIKNDDYLSIGTEIEYMNIINHFKNLQQTKTIDFHPNQENIGKTHIMPESAHRVNTIYSVNGVDAMLTRWSLRDDKARICVPKEFINTKFRSSKGVLSISMAIPSTTECMWKFSWTTEVDMVHNEFYLKDQCYAGHPSKSKADVLEILEKILNLD